MGMNRRLVGRVYPEQRYRVEAAAIRAYARAINEDNPSFFGPEAEGGMMAPPLFPVVYHSRALGQAVGDPELGIDFKRALHGEQDMRFHAAIRPNDTISTTVRIEAIEEKSAAETLSLALESRNQDGQPVETTLFTLFVRGPKPALGSGTSAEPTEGLRDPMLAVTQRLDADQTFRYADASGDRTPIHLDPAVARKAGFPGIIAHGLCTMAFVSKALVDHLGAGDPTRLAQMGVRFAQPVFPGQKIETRIEARSRAAGDAVRHFGFETWNPDGDAVIRAGRAELRLDPGAP